MPLFFSHVEVPSTSFATLIHRDRQHEDFDPGRDYSAISPMPTHRWTIEQKTVLWLLKERYEIGWADMKILFDELFGSEFYSRYGPSKIALRSMYDTLQRIQWTPTGSWKPLCAALEAKAAEIGMELIKEHQGVQRGGTNEWHDSFSDDAFDIGEESDTTLLGDQNDPPPIPSRHCRNVPIGGALESSRLRSCSNSQRQEPTPAQWQFPRLAYRSL